MARIVYVSSGLVGILNSGLEIARRLRVAGHDVTFVGWRDIADAVEQHGFTFVRIDHDDRSRRALREHAAQRGAIRSIPTARRLRRELIASTEIEDTLRGLAPDLLIIDTEMHTAVIASRSLGVPTLIRTSQLSPFRDWRNPPLHTDLDAPHDLRSNLRCRTAWMALGVRRLWTNTLGQLRPDRASGRVKPFPYGTVQRHHLVQFARARSIRLRDLTEQFHWLYPHVYTTIDGFSTTLAELEMRPVSSPLHQYVGPMIHPVRVDPRVTDDAQARWRAFRDAAVADDQPVVYCTIGTLHRDVLQRVRNVVAAADGADWRLVVGLGARSEPDDVGDVPDNVLVLDYAPQIDVLQEAAVAVVHGGINTINECLWAGVPMVVHRHGRIEQPGNASRVEHHGLGVRVDLDAGAGGVRNAVDRVLADPTFRERLAATRADLEGYDGRLEQLVDRTLARPVRSEP